MVTALCVQVLAVKGESGTLPGGDSGVAGWGLSAWLPAGRPEEPPICSLPRRSGMGAAGRTSLLGAKGEQGLRVHLSFPAPAGLHSTGPPGQSHR